MEPEQRGRRASSTSSLGREVRCGCQYYQSDSLLPERRALLIRPSSRTMQQPPAVRCRSVYLSSTPMSRNRRPKQPDHLPFIRTWMIEQGVRWFSPGLFTSDPPVLFVAHLKYRLHRAKPHRGSPRLFKVRPAGYRQKARSAPKSAKSSFPVRDPRLEYAMTSPGWTRNHQTVHWILYRARLVRK